MDKKFLDVLCSSFVGIGLGFAWFILIPFLSFTFNTKIVISIIVGFLLINWLVVAIRNYKIARLLNDG